MKLRLVDSFPHLYLGHKLPVVPDLPAGFSRKAGDNLYDYQLANKLINVFRTLENYTDCGTMSKNRIIGGQSTEENEIPWMCAIMREDNR